MRTRNFLFALLAAALCGGGALMAGGPGIIRVSVYGDDNRVDQADASAKLQAMSNSVPALFLASELKAEADGSFSLKTARPLGTSRGMADGQRFTDQNRAAYCSGALVGEDLVFTAGHCVVEYYEGEFDCKTDKVVFGFSVTSRGGKAPSTFPAADVYGCRKVITWKKTGITDYALIQLDRKVSGRVPLAINREGGLKAGTPLAVIGYPDGLPLKVADSAKVRSIPAGKPYFFTDLDTFHGNSGSPVFNTKTFRIEGILARGDEDYQFTADGTKVAVYGQDAGKGEEVTMISEISALIPQTEFERYLDSSERSAQPKVKAVPAIYMPGSEGGATPALYELPAVSSPKSISI